jgi:molecular chaperone GrpE
MSDVNNTSDEIKDKEILPKSENDASEDIVEDVQEDNADEDSNTVNIEEGTNLMQALIDAQKEAQANNDGWQRARAEFANYKKRVDRERTELFQRASLDTLKDLLPIIDDFDRAFGNIPSELTDNPWIGGVSLIQRKFENMLEKYEIEPIDPSGELFDPNLHEAVGTDDTDDVESGHVSITLQKGYKAGNQILRPAMVKVAN